MNKGHVIRVMLLWVVRMNGMGHVSGKEEALVD